MSTGTTQQIIDYGATPDDGTGDSLRTAFIKTDNNFSNIWAAGPVGSNISITDNTILVDDTNGNLVLMPNGVGVIEARNHVVPRLNNTYSLGSGNLSWYRVYTNQINAKDMTLSGNLTVAGNVIESGNIVTDSLTIQLANSAANSAQADGAGITVGQNDDIATFLYDSTSNTWQTNVPISTSSLAAAGANRQIQFNNSGTFGASPNLTYDSSSNTFSVSNAQVDGTVVVGTSTPVDGAKLQVLSTNSILVPVGTNDDRPGGVTGMVRFNTTLDTLEFYNSTAWVQAGSDFTVIVTDTFVGDGSTMVFDLSQSTTTDGAIVSINGIVQTPITAYSILGTTMTFTEPPSFGDGIEVRILTTTVMVGSLGNDSGNAAITASASSPQINVTGSLIPTGNATANIGSSSHYFNRLYAASTSAVYSDLAEMYQADAAYAPGTVLSFGGSNEVTQSCQDADTRVAGVVSTAPSYLMNSTLDGDNVVALALVGRVPTWVTGCVRKGDMMVSNGDGRARAESNPAMGTVIGKALADFDGDNGMIEIVIGRI